MRRQGHRAGMTLVEVLIALVLVSAAAAVVYQSVFYSYKTMMRSRIRLDAQGIAMDKLWEVFNWRYENLPVNPGGYFTNHPTPADSLFSTNGIVECWVTPELNDPVSRFDYWEVIVQVWAPTNSPLFTVTDTSGAVIAEYPRPLAAYQAWRYRGDRE